MNWFGTLLLVVGVPFVIWMGYDIWADWRESRHRPPRCACRRWILRDRVPRHDNGDLKVHGVDICQPYREWLDD